MSDQNNIPAASLFLGILLLPLVIMGFSSSGTLGITNCTGQGGASICAHRSISIQIEGGTIVGSVADFGPVTNASLVIYATIQIVLNTNFNLYYITGQSDHAAANECVIRIAQLFGTTFSFSVVTTIASQGAIDGSTPIYTALGNSANHRVFAIRLYDMNAVTACNFSGLLVMDSF